MRLDIDFLPLRDGIRVPEYARDGDAAFDLRAAEHAVLAPGRWATIGTGFAVGLPRGVCMLVASRSGLAANHGISVLNAPGLIDSGYRGEVKVILQNHSVEAFEVKAGDRIAQALVLPIPAIGFRRVDRLEGSARGEGGLGSTGR